VNGIDHHPQHLELERKGLKRAAHGQVCFFSFEAVQRAFMAHHGVQCGFCTPGFLMLATGVLEREPDISDDELREVLSSNLCRCTGYQNIVAAVRAAIAELRERSA
jgi:carbon-monoxide dehydrogenase small subunit